MYEIWKSGKVIPFLSLNCVLFVLLGTECKLTQRKKCYTDDDDNNNDAASAYKKGIKNKSPSKSVI